MMPNYNQTTETSCSGTIRFKVIRTLPVLLLDAESLTHAVTGRLSAGSYLCPPSGVGRLPTD